MSENKVTEILNEREKTHGPFSNHSKIAQRLKEIVFDNNGSLNDIQKESLEMIMHKVARILNGDPSFKDHWDDIAGYATLVSKSISK